MPLTQPNHDLKRDLQGIASDLKWSVVELMRIAERLNQSGHEADTQAVRKMCTVLGWGEWVGGICKARIVLAKAE